MLLGHPEEAVAPSCSADAGADVIKVESPDGDPLRRWTNTNYWEGTPDGEDGALFQFLHFGHRSIVVDRPHETPSTWMVRSPTYQREPTS